MPLRNVAKAFVHKGKIYNPGLQDLSEEEIADLGKRGAFDGGPAAADAPKSAPVPIDPSVEAELQNQWQGQLQSQLEPIAARIGAGLGVERSSDETPLQFLERFAGECEGVAQSIEERLTEQKNQFDASFQQAQDEMTALRTKRDEALAHREEAVAENEKLKAEIDAFKAAQAEAEKAKGKGK